MKKAYLLFLFILCLFSCTMPVDAAEPDFRKVSWGMSVEEVLLAEEAECIKEHSSLDRIVYRESAFGRTGILFYDFEEEKLAKATYLFGELTAEEAKGLFKDIKTVLSKKYTLEAPALEIPYYDNFSYGNTNIALLGVSYAVMVAYSPRESREKISARKEAEEKF